MPPFLLLCNCLCHLHVWNAKTTLSRTKRLDIPSESILQTASNAAPSGPVGARAPSPGQPGKSTFLACGEQVCLLAGLGPFARRAADDDVSPEDSARKGSDKWKHSLSSQLQVNNWEVAVHFPFLLRLPESRCNTYVGSLGDVGDSSSGLALCWYELTLP